MRHRRPPGRRAAVVEMLHDRLLPPRLLLCKVGRAQPILVEPIHLRIAVAQELSLATLGRHKLGDQAAVVRHTAHATDQLRVRRVAARPAVPLWAEAARFGTQAVGARRVAQPHADSLEARLHWHLHSRGDLRHERVGRVGAACLVHHRG
eukprot:4002884-Prymnesium_polylepis.1